MSEQGKIMVKNVSKKPDDIIINRLFGAYGKIVKITVIN